MRFHRDDPTLIKPSSVDLLARHCGCSRWFIGVSIVNCSSGAIGSEMNLTKASYEDCCEMGQSQGEFRGIIERAILFNITVLAALWLICNQGQG